MDLDPARLTFGHDGFDYYAYEGKLKSGSNENFMVRLNSASRGARINKIEIIDMSGNHISETIPTYKPEYDASFGNLTIPAKMFQIIVYGVDAAGYPFQRQGNGTFGN